MAWSLDKILALHDKLLVQFPREKAKCGMNSFDYFVLPRNWDGLPKGFPECFAIRMTPPRREMRRKIVSHQCLFAVSEAIKPQWRPFIARHEFWEYVGLVVYPELPPTIISETDTIENGCLYSSVIEWASVLQELQPSDCRAYASMRAAFFAELMEFAATAKGYEAKALENFSASANFWMNQIMNDERT